MLWLIEDFIGMGLTFAMLFGGIGLQCRQVAKDLGSR